jgi:hypothetical protein
VVKTEDAWKGVHGKVAEEEYMREVHGKGTRKREQGSG